MRSSFQIGDSSLETGLGQKRGRLPFSRRCLILSSAVAITLITALGLFIWYLTQPQTHPQQPPPSVSKQSKDPFFNPFHVVSDPNSYPGLVWIPPDLKAPAPLLLFLHGSGQFANPYNLRNLVSSDGATPPAEIYCDAHPDYRKDCSGAASAFKNLFVLAAPQGEEDEKGWEKDRISRFVDFLLSDGPNLGLHLDPSRLYLTGWSAGARGVLQAAQTGRFAAIAPVALGCSQDDLKALSSADAHEDVLLFQWCREMVNVSKLLHVPIWAFHAATDDLCVPESTSSLIGYLQRKDALGNRVKMTLYPEGTKLPLNGWNGGNVWHFSSVPAYMTEELYTWFLSWSTPADAVSV